MKYEIFSTCMLVPNVSTANCSGWVQAWGSLLGLAIAIAVPALIRYLEERSNAETLKAIAEVTAFDVLHLLYTVVGQLKTLEERIALPYAVGEANSWAEYVEGIPLPTTEQLHLLARVVPKGSRAAVSGKRGVLGCSFNLRLQGTLTPNETEKTALIQSELVGLLSETLAFFEILRTELKSYTAENEASEKVARRKAESENS